MIFLKQHSISNDLVCNVLNKLSIIRNIILKVCAKKAKSKDFKVLEYPVPPQIDSSDDLGSSIIVSKTVLNLDYSSINKCKIFDSDDHLVWTNWRMRFPTTISTTLLWHVEL